MAYILGLYAADGNIYKDRICLQQSGIEGSLLIEWVVNELKFNGNINTINFKNINHRYAKNFSFLASKKLIEELKSYNITERKSLIYKFPEKLKEEFRISFIRGYIDGDGSVFTYIRNRKKITKSGIEKQYKERCLTISLFGAVDFCKFIMENIEVIPNKKIRIRNNGAELIWNYTTARRFGKLLYEREDLPYSLKKQKYNNFKSCSELLDMKNKDIYIFQKDKDKYLVNNVLIFCKNFNLRKFYLTKIIKSNKSYKGWSYLGDGSKYIEILNELPFMILLENETEFA